MGAELYHADRQTDGRTDIAKLIIAFRIFGKALKYEHNIWEPWTAAVL
jgi:hypothetical protein